MQALLPEGAAVALTAWLALTMPVHGGEPETAASTPAADAVSVSAAQDESREAVLERRDAAQQTLANLSDQERYEEAVAIAREIVDLTTRVYGEKSIERAAPLANLATAQMHQGDLVAAEANYQASIAIVEANEGLTSMRLIDPVIGVAETYMKGGLYEQANAAYRRALQVNHAENGFYNLEQVKILDGLSESYLALEKLGQANAQQRIQVDIQRHRSGRDSPETFPAMLKLGRWYNRTEQYPDAHLVFQDIQQRASEFPAESDAIVDALLGEALTFEKEGASLVGENKIKRALRVLDSPPQADHNKKARVLVALGDNYMLSGKPRNARDAYGNAWRELSADEALAPERDRYFARPAQLQMALLPTLVDESGRGIKKAGADLPRVFADGFVVASMTVNANGDARNISIVESNPPGLLDRQVLRTLGFAIFRPRMEDGAVVDSDVVQFRHDYRYPQPTPASAELPAPGSGEAAGSKGAPIHYPDEPDEPDKTPK